MNVTTQIKNYIESLPESKQTEMLELHQLIHATFPKRKLWYEDGKDNTGKTISNPNIGYGSYEIKYANGKSREFYQVGICANQTGISVYILGIKDKTLLSRTFGKEIGKAKLTGYCIKFKSLNDINRDILLKAVKFGLEATMSE